MSQDVGAWSRYALGSAEIRHAQPEEADSWNGFRRGHERPLWTRLSATSNKSDFAPTTYSVSCELLTATEGISLRGIPIATDPSVAGGRTHFRIPSSKTGSKASLPLEVTTKPLSKSEPFTSTAKRMVIHVQGGTGRKDRDVMLSPRLLAELRQHWRGLRQKSSESARASCRPRGPRPTLGRSS
jgi:hypothetical protein